MRNHVFTLWHARSCTGELEAQLAFWRRQLAYAPPLLSLPTDYPRQDCGEPREARGVPLLLPAGLMTQLNNVANAAGVSPFMALLAVWQVREGTLWPIACSSELSPPCSVAARLHELYLAMFSCQTMLTGQSK